MCQRFPYLGARWCYGRRIQEIVLTSELVTLSHEHESIKDMTDKIKDQIVLLRKKGITVENLQRKFGYGKSQIYHTLRHHKVGAVKVELKHGGKRTPTIKPKMSVCLECGIFCYLPCLACKVRK